MSGAREERGLKNKFLASYSGAASNAKFECLDPLDLHLTLAECMELGDKARRRKLWSEASEAAKRYDDFADISKREFFRNFQLADVLDDDVQALLACRDAKILERYIDRETF